MEGDLLCEYILAVIEGLLRIMPSSNFTLYRCGVVFGVVLGVSKAELLVSDICLWYSTKALSIDGDSEMRERSLSVSDEREDFRGEGVPVEEGRMTPESAGGE